MSRFDRGCNKDRNSHRGVAGAFRPTSRPRILYFATRELWPPDTGAKVRNYYLAREMGAYADVTYLAFSDRPEAVAAESVWLRGENHYTHRSGRVDDEMPAGGFERIVSVSRERGYRLSNLLLGAIGQTPLTVLNYTTAEMAKCLAAILDEGDFDIVHMAGLHLSGYLPIIRNARSRPAVVSDWHNVESELMRRYSNYAPSVAHRLYARTTARRLRDLERRLMGEFDAHTVVSERDRLKLLEKAPGAPVYVVENGVDVERYSDEALDSAYRAARLPLKSFSKGLLEGHTDVERFRLLFVGSMDYHANEDAALHFANQIWPEQAKRTRRLEFTIVGRRPSARLTRLSSVKGIEVTGTVHDVRPYYREAIAAVVPLRVGGGSRLKILEAMAAGVPVVSSTLGAEGLDVTDSQHLLLADSPGQFVSALNSICDDFALWRTLSSAGRELVRRKYSWTELARACKEVHRAVLDGRWTAVEQTIVGPKEQVQVLRNGDADWAPAARWVQHHGKIG